MRDYAPRPVDLGSWREAAPPVGRVRPTNAFVTFAKEATEQSIPARFEQQVARDPDHLAVKSREHAFTYAELNEAANRIAHAILARRGEEEEPVALLFEQGAPVIAAILGVLKAGKIVVPLDPAHPRARIRDLLGDSQAALIVTDTRNDSLARELAPEGCPLINVAAIDPRVPRDDPGVAISPDRLASILYTSGSTGQPKGVVENHRVVLHHMMRTTNGLHVCAADRQSLIRSVTFSGAMRDVLSALLNGAALCSLNLGEEGIARLAPWLIQEEITIYRSPVSVFRRFARMLTGAETFPRLRFIHLGGETMSTQDVELYKRHFDAHCLLLNGLGITEAGMVRHFFIDKQTEITGSSVPVGYAVEDMEVLLLDEDGEPVRGKGVGEIAVRSPYLALGYWRRPDLTRAAFLPDPAGGSPPIYRTGDLGRMLPDGCLLHLGRKDFQIKIRGHRIETAEVEMALLSHASVREAVVTACDGPEGERRLVAYVVPTAGSTLSHSALQRFMRQKLPEYMVPAAFVALECLPTTPTGKVDRRALPPPGRFRPDLDTLFVAPRTPVEEVLAAVWAEVLCLDAVGVHDSFLELGGDSFLTAQLIARVEAAFQVELPLGRFLEAPTVAGLAETLAAQEAAPGKTAAIARLRRQIGAMSAEEVRASLQSRGKDGAP